MTSEKLSDEEYGHLLALRTGLRRFERWSAQQAESAGLTPAQHQLLLAIRGHAGPTGPTVGEVADYLLLQHHSTVGLVDRAESAGLVRRTRDKEDHRIVRLHLTRAGAKRLESLSALHLQELSRLALDLPAAWAGLSPSRRPHGFSGPLREVNERTGRSAVAVARVYEAQGNSGARQVLVDRLWPRGVSRNDAPFDEWLKDVAPSTELRKWYGHDPKRFEQFERRYLGELASGASKQAFAKLRSYAQTGEVTLLTATRSLELSAASVLARALAGEIRTG